jgi:surface carbohydrate biosynthesis protein (TIGR04326 family)
LAKVVIWDAEGLPPQGEQWTVLWRSFSNYSMPNTISIPTLVEENAEILRSRYLAWVYDFGVTCIDGKQLKDHLELRPGFSYWWMTLFVEKCNYGKSPHINDAIRLMALDTWAVDHVMVGASIKLVSANKPLAECISRWCVKLSAKFEWQSTPKVQTKQPWFRCAYQRFPLVLQAAAGLLRYLVERLPLRGVGLTEWQQTDGRITFFSYLFNLDVEAAKEKRYSCRYWGDLPEVLQSEDCKTNWLHLYVKNELLPSAVKAAALIRNFNKTGRDNQVHVTLDSFLSLRVVGQTLHDWSRLSRTGRRLKRYIFPAATPGLDLSPLFVEDWRETTGGLSGMINLLNLNLFLSALKMLPKQRVGVYLQENQAWEVGLIQGWRSAGQGRLVGCPHSSVRFWDLRYFADPRSYSRVGINFLPLPCKIGLNGNAAMETYLSGGYPADNLVQVEALRYLYLNHLHLRPVTEFLATPHSLRLLVLGDYLPSNTHLQLQLLEMAVRNMSTEIIVTLKPHPACPIKPEDYPKLDMTVTMAPLASLFEDCDVAFASAVTTAAVDAYCARIPVVSVLDPKIFNLSPLRGYLGAYTVSTSEELARALVAAVSTRGLIASKEAFFKLDPNLPRWRQLLL